MFRKLAMAASVWAACAAAPAPARAQAISTEAEAFVASNLVAIFYHELGHALIDILGLPIFGQEEDAADVLSILMVHDIFEEESAVEIAYATAFSFLGEAEERQASGEEVAWWDLHGADLQRYYTLVCLFYGGAPEERQDMAEELGLPEERAETCTEEFELADGSWGPVLEELRAAGAGETLRFTAVQDDDPHARLTAQVVGDEVAALNSEMSLPAPLDVRVEYCDTPNAFYDPSDRSVTMCIEFSSYLAGLAE